MPRRALVQSTTILAALLRARAMPAPRQEAKSGFRSSSDAAGGGPGCITIRPGKAIERTKKKRKAERRKALFRNRRISRCGAPSSEGARLSAFHHGTCGRDRTPPLSSSHATSQDRLRARNPDGSKDRAHRNTRREADSRLRLRHSRALPAPTCPSPARLHPRSGHDAVRACLAQAARARR